MTATPSNPPSVWAIRLGYAGLIPFVLLASAHWALPPVDPLALARALVAYAAVIASFLGALHWGLLMRAPARQSLTSLAWGVVPSLLGWVALALRPDLGLWLAGALLWACYGADRRVYPVFQVQGWLPMRLVLTSVASLSCFAAAARLHLA